MKRRHSRQPIATRLMSVGVLVSLTACTSMQEVPGNRIPLDELLRTGDHIIVYERSGRVLDLRYVLIEDGELRGSFYEDGLTAVTVAVEDIEKIEAERVAVGRSAVAVAGGVVLLPIAALGLGMAAAEQ